MRLDIVNGSRRSFNCGCEVGCAVDLNLNNHAFDIVLYQAGDEAKIHFWLYTLKHVIVFFRLLDSVGQIIS